MYRMLSTVCRQNTTVYFYDYCRTTTATISATAAANVIINITNIICIIIISTISIVIMIIVLLLLLLKVFILLLVLLWRDLAPVCVFHSFLGNTLNPTCDSEQLFLIRAPGLTLIIIIIHISVLYVTHATEYVYKNTGTKKRTGNNEISIVGMLTESKGKSKH